MPTAEGEGSGDILRFNLDVLSLAGGLEETRSLALTGGEPTLRLDDLCELIRQCGRRAPKAELALLTNGRAYRDAGVVERIADLHHPDLTHCVSLQADTAATHDEVMGARGAFADTVAGLQHLALARQAVEIRVVICLQNAARLPGLAEFIWRNFPFVGHVALMGLETTERGASERVWIEPSEYVELLEMAVCHLHRRGLRVSIYNLPLCVLPERLHRFAKDSISDWKKTYPPVCEVCAGRAACCGVFGTGERVPLGLRPIPA